MIMMQNYCLLGKSSGRFLVLPLRLLELRAQMVKALKVENHSFNHDIVRKKK